MNIEGFYDKNYKKLMLIPFAILFFFAGIIAWNYYSTGEIIKLDISLKGGTFVTVYINQSYSISELANSISKELNTTDIVIRELKNPIAQSTIGYNIEVGLEVNRSMVEAATSRIFKMNLTAQNSNVGSQGAALASSFFKDAALVLIVAFLFMGFISYLYFRTPFSAFSLMLTTAADFIDIMGVLILLDIRFSIASIGALLMILAYSADSDVLLLINVLKRHESTIIYRMKQVFKTEITMNVAAYVTFTVMFLLSNVDVIRHIALILLIGTLFDTLDTFLLGGSIQRAYVEWRQKKI